MKKLNYKDFLGFERVKELEMNKGTGQIIILKNKGGKGFFFDQRRGEVFIKLFSKPGVGAR